MIIQIFISTFNGVDGSFRFSTFFLRIVWVKKAKVRAIRVDDPQFLPVIDNTK
jgi:hypothetical protein